MSSTPPPTASDAGLRNVHTSNLPALFGQLQVSLVVSTYQAGKVILIRNGEGVLNTHFRTFGKPMGDRGRSGAPDHRRDQHGVVLPKPAGRGGEAGAAR